MSYLDLLDRIRSNDADAFLELTNRYGWSVYSAIREKYADHAVADKIYNETMNAFYHSLSDSAAEDPLEAVLCAFASQISEKEMYTETFPLRQSERNSKHTPPTIHLSKEERSLEAVTAQKRKKNSFWYHLAVLLVLAAIAAVFWCIVGLLMDLNYIPDYDLGYSWFNANVMQLF